MMFFLLLSHFLHAPAARSLFVRRTSVKMFRTRLFSAQLLGAMISAIVSIRLFIGISARSIVTTLKVFLALGSVRGLSFRPGFESGVFFLCAFLLRLNRFGGRLRAVAPATATATTAPASRSATFGGLRQTSVYARSGACGLGIPPLGVVGRKIDLERLA